MNKPANSPAPLFGNRARCYVIAEAGSNHNGDFEQAVRLIDVAVESRADAVKFQLFKAELLYPRSAGRSDYLKLDRSIYDIIEEMEMPSEWVPRLAEHCVTQGIDFLSTPFDEGAADLLEPFVPVFKVASYEMTHHPLLRHIARKGKPMIISTGTADLSEVEEAVRVVRQAGNEDIVLMQCTAAYPAPPESVNVRAMETLHRATDLPVGLSDHSRDPTVAPMAAVALGACRELAPSKQESTTYEPSPVCKLLILGCRLLIPDRLLGASVIEKHFTLSRDLQDPDHAFSVEPDELRRIRDVEAVLGDGRKVPHAVEEELRKFARRTVFASRAIETGETLSGENIAVLRCGVREFGFGPDEFDCLLGRVAARHIEPESVLTLEDLE